MLILVLAANTSFADFPRLASFHAGDNFMPRQLTKRGHRLVFSNGIISLAVVAAVVMLATDAKVDRLIPLYAIGVFTSFTMSQAGMAKHHLTHKEPGWRKGFFVNGFGCLPLACRRRHHPDHQVRRRRLDRRVDHPDHGLRPDPAEQAVRSRSRRARRGRPQGGGEARSCAATRCSCWSRSSTWPRPGPSSTPGRWNPTSCGPSTSSSTGSTPTGCRRNGAASAWPGCPSR